MEPIRGSTREMLYAPGIYHQSDESFLGEQRMRDCPNPNCNAKFVFLFPHEWRCHYCGWTEKRIQQGGMMTNVKPYTAEEIQTMKDMYTQGKYAPEIAVALGRSEDAINLRLTKLRKSGELIKHADMAADLPPVARHIATLKRAGFRLVRCDVVTGIYEVEAEQ